MPAGALPSFMKWLPVSTTATINRCEFMCRGPMDGFITGRHRSAKKGASVEFADYRQYLPGDEIKMIDWKVYGRKDRYYIKQSMAETNVRVMICLDCSGSMDYRGDLAAPFEGRPLSKFEYAKYLAAGLASMFIGQQDGVGLTTFDTKVREFLPAKASKGQLFNLLRFIDAAEVGGETELSPIFDEVAERIPPRGVVVVISDLLGDTSQLMKAFQHVHYRRHELIVLHVMAEEELRFPFKEFVHFQDLEGPTELELDPKSIRADYLDRVNAFVKMLTDGCSGMRADYVPLSTKTPFDKGLTEYLARRATGIG